MVGRPPRCQPPRRGETTKAARTAPAVLGSSTQPAAPGLAWCDVSSPWGVQQRESGAIAWGADAWARTDLPVPPGFAESRAGDTACQRLLSPGH